jgi:carboxyl-terminal processing protease
MIKFSYKAIAIVLISAFSLSSCNLKETIFPKKNTAITDEVVNSWIYSEMKEWYLWESQLPAESATKKTLTPDAYFESLLYKPGEMDRFSWIEESSEELANSLAGKNTVLGVRTAAFFTDETKKNVALSVAYVLKNSPAERAGLKRGDFITEVGGVAITNDNFRTILSPETLSLTLGSYNNSTNTITSTTKKINVVKAEVQTIPVQMDTVITKGNKKIGYIHYVQFIPGIRKSDGTPGKEFDDQLRAVFANFKAKGVNELVLDVGIINWQKCKFK